MSRGHEGEGQTVILRGQLTQRGGTAAKALVALAVSAFAILLLTTVGCGGGGAAQTGSTATTAPGVTSGTGPSSTATGPATSGDGAASEAAVTIVDAPNSVPLDLPHLGNVSYSIDDTVTAVTAPVSVMGRYGPQAHRQSGTHL